MKSNGFTLLNRLLLAFDYRMQERYPVFAPLIKYLETALVQYYEDKSTIDPNWLEWIVTTNNSLPARESQGYSIESIEFVHQLLRKRLANYDKTVNGNKALYSPYVQDVHFKRVYGFHNYPLILKHILKNAPRASVVSSDDDSTSSESSPLLSRDVLSPLNSNQLKSSSESPYDVVSPHRRGALFPPPNAATSVRTLSLTLTN